MNDYNKAEIDIENKLVVTSGEREGGRGQDSGKILRHKLLYIK